MEAVGLASNVVQFVDFTLKLFNETRRIYKSSGNGDHDALDAISTGISRKSDAIIVSAEYPRALQKLAEACKKIADDLVQALAKATHKGKNEVWDSFTLALKEDMAVQLVFLLDNKQSAVHQELMSIKRACESLGTSMHGQLMDLKKFLISEVENLAPRDALVDSSNKCNENPLERSSSSSRRESGKVYTLGHIHQGLVELQFRANQILEDQKLLRSLSFDHIRTRQNAIEKAHPTTFTWAFDNHLAQWLHSTTPDRIFWIRGKAGSGKSNFMKFISQHKTTRRHLQRWAGTRDLIIASYYFWYALPELQKTIPGLLRSLLFDILMHCPHLISITRERLRQRGLTPLMPNEEPWTADLLQYLLESLLPDISSHRICVLIDGLDEYSGNGQILIDLVKKFGTCEHVKLCVSSRPWTEYIDAFGDNAQYTIKLEELTKDDIRQYVCIRLQSSSQFCRLNINNPSHGKIVDSVSKKARGVFLWVVLVVRSLLEGALYHDDPSEMRRRIDEFPQDLNDCFQRIIESIPAHYREKSARTLLITIEAEQPLPLTVHRHAQKILDIPNFTNFAAEMENWHEFTLGLTGIDASSNETTSKYIIFTVLSETFLSSPQI
ncbi:hypothetical protein F5Y15DRAFT_417441 [Xylariaceae sp. FL0016]|nr:hypothetical protein F5Y15DRAFT_417441 [Xylariaceae sp. FL0016]